MAWKRFGSVLYGCLHGCGRRIPKRAWAAAMERIEPKDHVWIRAGVAGTVALSRWLRTVSPEGHVPASVVIQVERFEGDQSVAFATFSARVALARLGIPFGFTSKAEQSVRFLAARVPFEQRAQLERVLLAHWGVQGSARPMAA